MVPQGLATSKTTRFVGCDDLYTYERDLETGCDELARTAFDVCRLPLACRSPS